MVLPFFGDLFHNWSNISKVVLAGPAEFKPFFRYLSYDDACSAISVVRNRVKTKTTNAPDEKELAKKDLLLQPMEYLSDYDLGDDDEEPAMEHKQRRVQRRRRDARGRSPPLEYLPDYDLGDEEEEPAMEHKQKRVQRRRDARGRSPPLENLSDYDLGDEEEEPAMEHKQKKGTKEERRKRKVTTQAAGILI
jgi:hypothetical protein